VTALGHTARARGLLKNLDSFKPTFLLAVPRIFEKVHSGKT
jgi:long-chain acyl-CoA synthetase